MSVLSMTPGIAAAFARNEHGYDISVDVAKIGLLMPWLVQLDQLNGPQQHITDGASDYYRSVIAYGQSPDRVAAHREFLTVMPKSRTEMGYIPMSAQPKHFQVVSGDGWLVIARQPDQDGDSLEQTRYYLIDGDVSEGLTVAPGSFYVFLAHSSELTVTTMTEADEAGNWPITERTLVPGTESLVIGGEGMVLVPDDFVEALFD